MFEHVDGKAKFIRGRINEKENRWVNKFQVGRTTFEQGESYEVADVLKLTANGIRVVLEPPQPVVEKVVKASSWKDIGMKAVEKEPKTEAPTA